VPPADPSADSPADPGSDPARALVWRSGDALLAVPVDAVLEVTDTDDEGRARSRRGPVPLSAVPGLQPAGHARRAVVVRSGGTTLALAADEVEGVREYTVRESAPTPPWLGTLPTGHLAGLVRLDEGRVAALLAVDTLHRP